MYSVLGSLKQRINQMQKESMNYDNLNMSHMTSAFGFQKGRCFSPEVEMFRSRNLLTPNLESENFGDKEIKISSHKRKQKQIHTSFQKFRKDHKLKHLSYIPKGSKGVWSPSFREIYGIKSNSQSRRSQRKQRCNITNIVSTRSIPKVLKSIENIDQIDDEVSSK